MCADLSLAREKLGYQPRFSLEEGLRLTLERDPRFQDARVPAADPCFEIASSAHHDLCYGRRVAV